MVNVVCAIIEKDDLIFIAQRGPKSHLAFKWEFPGGKIMEGETPEECIIREITEELCLNIEPKYRLKESIHDYGTKVIRLIPFICKLVSGELLLKEHNQYKWINASEFLRYDWCEADIPIINSYLLQKN